MPLDDQRAVANVRERKRTQKLNQAYKQLQSIIPKEPSDKMSKIHTLKLALAYIHFLKNILKETETDTGPCISSTSMYSGSSSQHVKSPCASSPSSYAHISATSGEEDDDDECQHRSKRAKFNSMDVADNNSLSKPVVTPCYTTFNGYVPVQAKQLDCNSCHECTTRHQVVSPDNSAFYDTRPSTTDPEDMTNYLRSAFREYRTGKRKSFS